MKYNVLGVCNGQGIGLFPFKQNKRFKIVGNIEPRREYLGENNSQWALNFSGIPFFKELETSKEILDDIKVHIIIGNPKCGSNSILRLSRNKEFKEIKSVKEEKTLSTFCSSVAYFKPHAFLMENLPRLLEIIPLKTWEKEIFSKYDLLPIVDSVSVFGNSQISRKRLVMVGVRKSSKIWKIEDFMKIYQINPLKNTQDLLKNLPKNGNIVENPDKILSMYDYRDKNRTNLSIFEISKLWKGIFKDKYRWPWKNSKGNMGTLPGVYRNKPLDYPMTARKADRQFHWNGYPHSPRELARIMGIPDSYQIYIDPKKLNYWINKGRFCVTTTFPYEIGQWFYESLFKAIK